MKYRKGLLVGAFWFAVLLSVDMLRWVMRGKSPTVDGVIGSLLGAALSGWCSMLSRDAWGVGFLAWAVATVLGLIVYIAIGRAIHLSPSQDAVATYAAEFLPFLVVVGVVMACGSGERAGRTSRAGRGI